MRKDSTIIIEDIERKVFDIFINWLYTRTILEERNDWNVVADLPYERLEPPAHTHPQQLIWPYVWSLFVQVKTYRFVNRLRVHCLRLDLNREIIEITPINPKAACGGIQLAFEKLPEEDPNLTFPINVKARTGLESNCHFTQICDYDDCLDLCKCPEHNDEEEGTHSRRGYNRKTHLLSERWQLSEAKQRLVIRYDLFRNI